jgi:CheY-like chemotaxis protein
MSEEFQKHMYENFASESNKLSEKEGGVGLGLAITESLIRLIGGSINCKSELSIGTTFTLTIPVELISKYNYEKCIEDKKIIKSENKISGKKILVCEDNAINRLVVNKILSNEHALLTFAKNGLEGVNLAKEENFDLILMDIRMPIMDGLEAARRIRTFNSKIPIIALSANAYEEDIEKSIKAGMSEHLSKPVDKNILVNTINKYF